MKRIALLCLLALGCATAPGMKGAARVFKSGSGPTYGTIDLLPTAPAVSDPGMVRLANTAGVLQASTNGGSYISVAGNSPQQVALNRARALLGATVNVVFGTDFENDQWDTPGTSGSGSATMSATLTGGVRLLATGTTASSFAFTRPHGTVSHLANGQTNVWYVYSRFQLATASDATTVSFVGMESPSAGNPIIGIGTFGTVSTTQFTGAVGPTVNSYNATGTSTAALDTNWHDAEIWNNGTTISFALDGVTFLTTPATNLPTGPLSLGALAGNGPGAANRGINVDRIFICTVSN